MLYFDSVEALANTRVIDVIRDISSLSKVRVLCTSTMDLGASFGKGVWVSTLDDASAISLFLHCWRLNTKAPAISRSNELYALVNKTLSNHPLSIVLTASRGASYGGIEDVINEWRLRGFQVTRDISDTLAESVALSTRLLSNEEKQVLTLCCLFPDPFYGQRWMDIESFVDSARSSWTRLSELNLIDLDTDGGKGFSVLSPVRDSVLKAERNNHVVMEGALLHALDYYLKIAKQINSLDASNDIRRLSYEYWNIPIALQEVREWNGPQVIERVQSLARALDGHCYTNVPGSIAVSGELLRIAGDRSDVATEALAHKNLGSAYREIDDCRKAMTHFNRAEELYRELGEGNQAAKVLRSLGAMDERNRDDASAIARYEEAFRLAESDDDRGAALLSMSLVNHQRGNQELWEEQSKKAGELMQKNDRKIAFELFTKGKVEFHTRPDDAGKHSILASIEYFDKVGDNRSRARGVLELGIGLAWAGKRQESDEALNAALGLFERVIDPLGTAKAHEWLAMSAKVYGKGAEEIKRHLDEADRAAKKAAPPLRREAESRLIGLRHVLMAVGDDKSVP